MNLILSQIVLRKSEYNHLSLRPTNDEDIFHLETKNLEGKYKVSICEDGDSEHYDTQCYSVIEDEQGNQARFFHQLNGAAVVPDSDLPWGARDLENQKRKLNILAHLRSLTNDQCKQMINEQKKKNNL